jgi:hypothetical protein
MSVAQWRVSNTYSKVHKSVCVSAPPDSKPNIMIDTICRMFVKNPYGQHAKADIYKLSAITHTNMANVQKKLEAVSLKYLKLKTLQEMLWTMNIFGCFIVLATVNV